MKHICEICNKQYDTVAGAEKCELAHKKEALEASAKTSMGTAISDAVNAYVAKFKEFPSIEITSENQKLLLGDFAEKLEKTFDMLVDILCEDDDEDDDEDECVCEKCDCDCKKADAE